MYRITPVSLDCIYYDYNHCTNNNNPIFIRCLIKYIFLKALHLLLFLPFIHVTLLGPRGLLHCLLDSTALFCFSPGSSRWILLWLTSLSCASPTSSASLSLNGWVTCEPHPEDGQTQCFLSASFPSSCFVTCHHPSHPLLFWRGFVESCWALFHTYICITY